MKKLFVSTFYICLFGTALMFAGCTKNGNSPVSPARGGSNTQTKEFLNVPGPWTRSTATYSFSVDGVSATSAYCWFYETVLETHYPSDPTPTGLYRYGIGISGTTIPTTYLYHVESNPYVAGVYGCSLSQSSGNATVHIFRDNGAGPVEVKTMTDSIAGNGFLCEVTVY